MTNINVLTPKAKPLAIKTELAPNMRVVVMGVCGSGKSTVGQALANAMGLDFVEGDALHPPGNVHIMASGTPLTDADRSGWLQEVANRLGDDLSYPRGVVVSCSALKLSYRDLLRAAVPTVRFVYLEGTALVLEERLRTRGAHFMAPSLLQSQLDTLEVPQQDENPVTLSILMTLGELVFAAAQALGVRESHNSIEANKANKTGRE